MSHWVLGSKKHSDGSRDVTIDFDNQDATGSMAGKLVLEGTDFHINGSWAASGSIAGRNYSAFALWGGTQGDGATVYVAATGTMQGPGNAPEQITINVMRTSTADGEQYAWDGELYPM